MCFYHNKITQIKVNQFQILDIPEPQQPEYNIFITEGNIIREFENYQPTENQSQSLAWEEIFPEYQTAEEWFNSE